MSRHHRRVRKLVPAILIVLTALGSVVLPARSAWARDPDLEWLAGALAGSFSNRAQAQREPEYLDVRLRVTRVWPTRADGPWLLVEQSMAATPLEPFRQRVLQAVRLSDGTFELRSHFLPDAVKWVGEGLRPEPLVSLSPRDLTRRPGCETRLRRRDDGVFEGATEIGTCPSSVAGASYLTSDVLIWPRRTLLWDRGWKAMGEQVWGATVAGYEFEKE